LCQVHGLPRPGEAPFLNHQNKSAQLSDSEIHEGLE
jgi:hypothetical protein